MKKTVFAIPLIVISLLVSCNKGGGGSKSDTFTVTLNPNNGEDSVVAVVKRGNLIPEEYIPKEAPSREDGYRTYTFNGWHKVTSEGMEEEEFDFTKETITEDTLVEAKWERGESKTYTLTAVKDPDQKLWFGTSRIEPFEETTITAGEVFSFCVFAPYGSEYKVPDMVDIYVGDSEVPLKDSYEYYEYRRQDDTLAEIRLNGNTICDDIRVEATPIKDNYYSIKIDNYGVKHDCASEHETVKDLVIQFSKDEGGHVLPATDNFYVKFDEGDWGELSKYSDICTYDEAKLTIKANKVFCNASIKVRSPYPSYNMLEDLTWKQIIDTSESGWGADFFYLGEEKTIKVNDLDHKVRIIGFNHDQISGAAKGVNAGVTFEFFNVITNSNGVEKVSWNNNDGEQSRNYNFKEYTLNKFLYNTKDNNCLFKRFPSELQGAIKTVQKDICTFTNKYTTDIPYNTKLFPLSYYEYTSTNHEWSMKEGNRYEYWKIHGEQTDRIKTVVGKTDGIDYWIRTPYTGLSWYAYNLKNNGGTSFSKVNVELGVAPAFCI